MKKRPVNCSLKDFAEVRNGRLSRSPAVSILTPTYNHQKYIRHCIESVLAQTVTDWEQVIIDDGSTDGTPEIIGSYKDPRIRYFRQDHTGIWKLGETYNRALTLARAPLVAILEGDDFWPPDKLEKQIPAFDDSGVALAWGVGIDVNSDGKPLGRPKKNHLRTWALHDEHKMTRKLLLGNFVTPSVTVMLRKEALMPGGFKQPPHVPFVDYPTWFKLALRGEFCFIDSILGYWRRHSEQMTVVGMWDMEKGNLATYFDLWQSGQVPLVLLLGLVPYSLTKYARRIVMKNLKGPKYKHKATP